MRLDITKGKGDVTVFAVSDADRKPVRVIVIDPRNATGPLPLKDWVEGSGGTVPLPEKGGGGGTERV